MPILCGACHCVHATFILDHTVTLKADKFKPIHIAQCFQSLQSGNVYITSSRSSSWMQGVMCVKFHQANCTKGYMGIVTDMSGKLGMTAECEDHEILTCNSQQGQRHHGDIKVVEHTYEQEGLLTG